MSSGLRVITDRETFGRWAQALSGLVLPEELRPGPPAGSNVPPELSPPIPPLVAASLAVHGCAEVAIMLRVSMPAGADRPCLVTGSQTLRELAADLRFALADCLSGGDRVRP